MEITQDEAIMLANQYRTDQDELVVEIKQRHARLKAGADPVVGWAIMEPADINLNIELLSKRHYEITNRLNEIQKAFGVGGRLTPEEALRSDLMVSDDNSDLG